MSDPNASPDWTPQFPGWHTVPQKTWINWPPGQPLPDEDIDRLKNDGIEFVKRLGRGGFGEVWRTRLTQFKTNQQNNYVPVVMACKITTLKSHFPKRTLKNAVYYMLREIEVLKNLSHEHVVRFEHVVRIFDETHNFPKPVYALCFMEYMNGNLRQLIKYLGKMPEKLALYWFVQIAEAVRYLHDSGVAHYDIKPENILLKEHPSDQDLILVKLTDFGLSEMFKGGMSPMSDTTAGTVDYMAPELKSGSAGPFDAYKTDVYSLGVTLAESTCGLPQPGQSPPLMLQVVKAIQQRRLFKAISPEIQDLLRYMTADDPQMRISIYDVLNHRWTKQIPYRPGYYFRIPSVSGP